MALIYVAWSGAMCKSIQEFRGSEVVGCVAGTTIAMRRTARAGSRHLVGRCSSIVSIQVEWLGVLTSERAWWQVPPASQIGWVIAANCHSWCKRTDICGGNRTVHDEFRLGTKSVTQYRTRSKGYAPYISPSQARCKSPKPNAHSQYKHREPTR
jgi:hypothetical protein